MSRNECVGSLIVHSSDMEELSEATKHQDHQLVDVVTEELSHDECVGTLLVHKEDMEEVTHEPTTHVVEDIKNELAHDECVGTLLVHKEDMEEVSGLGGGERIIEHLNESPEITKDEVMDLYNDV